MRIGLVVFNNPLVAPDGTARFVRDLSLELAARGEDVHVVHGVKPGTVARTLREEGGVLFQGLPYRPLGAGGSLVLSLRAIPALSNAHHRRPFDAMVFFGSPFPITVSARPRFPGVAMVYYAPGCILSEWHAFRQLYRGEGPLFALKKEMRYGKMALFEMALVRLSDRVLASSGATMDALLRYGIPRPRVHLCYLGARDPFAGEEIPSPGHAILHVATDHSRKGTDLLLRSLEVLDRRYGLRAETWIVGEPQQRYVDEAKRLGVDAHFLGRLPDADLLNLYRRAGLLALPSIDEGFSLPVVEAGFAGKPTVATDAACLPEMVRHGVDGLVVPQADAEAFARALHEVLADPGLKEKMGIRAREKSLGFTIGRAADRFTNHLEAIT